MMKSEKPFRPDPKLFYGLVDLATPTPLPELVADRAAIRAELKRDRKRHTVRVQSKLP